MTKTSSPVHFIIIDKCASFFEDVSSMMLRRKASKMKTLGKTPMKSSPESKGSQSLSREFSRAKRLVLMNKKKEVTPTYSMNHNRDQGMNLLVSS